MVGPICVLCVQVSLGQVVGEPPDHLRPWSMLLCFVTLLALDHSCSDLIGQLPGSYVHVYCGIASLHASLLV